MDSRFISRVVWMMDKVAKCTGQGNNAEATVRVAYLAGFLPSLKHIC